MGEIRSPYFSIDQEYLKDNAEIRSPYFSSGGDYRGYNAEICSPYFSSGGDYPGDGAEIRSPYFSFGTRDYHGDNAEIHSSYSSVADYLGEDAEIPSETFFQQNNIVENLYNAESFVEQDVAVNVYNTEKPPRRSDVRKLLFRKLLLDLPSKPSFGKITNDEKCIYKVHSKFPKSNAAFYIPQAVSIGPFHHELDLLIKETHKIEYLRAFCIRAVGETEEEQEKFLEELGYTVEENAEKIQQRYDDDAPVVTGDKFLTMVLCDAVFILEYLLRNNDYRKNGEDDSILRKMEWRALIRQDLMLLENQLPFFILEELYNHLLGVSERNYISFPVLTYEYFNRYININSEYKTRGIKDPLHFTDLIRSSLSFKLPNSKIGETDGFGLSVTLLQDARIKIKGPSNECLLNVNFDPPKDELLIPILQINYFTELLFRNLIAFEIRHYEKQKYICQYIKLFGSLIVNSKDANLLIKNKIILGDKDGDAVKDLIEKLTAEIPGGYDTIYYKLHEQLEKYQTKNIRKNKRFLILEYFGNRWKSTATVAAIILLLLAAVQTICAVVSLP